jgi:DNA polymerase-3 subunit alpha/error-prone DNA polymerase
MPSPDQPPTSFDPRPCASRDPAALGARLRACWPDGPPPFAVRTDRSVPDATVAAGTWAAALAALHGERSGPWALVADRDDLTGLPACLRTWGHGRCAIGAGIQLDRGAGALLLASGPGGHATLCRLLSWRHEHPQAWRAWSAGGPGPSWTGLTALVDDEAWARRVRDAGAEVAWRWGLRPGPCPAGLAPVAMPLLAHLDEHDRRGGALLAALAGGTAPPAAGCLADLAAMRDAYRDHPEALARGHGLLARCIAASPGGLRPPPHHGDADRELRELAKRGLALRYAPGHRAARERLDHELMVIAAKRFAAYILVVHGLARGRRTCGRGSAAGSLVCHCLGLTQVCPLAHGLLFERFLNPHRDDPPDIDLDFPWDERDAVIGHAFARHGQEHVAMVSSWFHYRDDAALRAVAALHGREDAEIARMQRALEQRRLLGRGLALTGPWPTILAQAAWVVDRPRHAGLHPGGMVVTAAPIRELVPVHRAAKRIAGPLAGAGDEPFALPAIAWDKDEAQAMGLVKIDLLGNRALAVVRDCLADLAALGTPIDPASWRPETDPGVFALIRAGRTLGCFGTADVASLVVHSSLVRPAAQPWIALYLERLTELRSTGRQREEWYPHPALRALLAGSLGVLAFQEDVMAVCRHLAGFDDAGADAVRRALGRVDTAERLGALSAAFLAGCRRGGVADTAAEQVWAQIASFLGYGFCKAHAASYARLSCECAWLKARHPALFLARVIAHQGGFHPTSAYIEEARRLSIAIRPPCVLASAVATRAEGDAAIRLGLHLVPGLSAAGAAAIVRARPFAGVRDLAGRCRLDRRDLAALVEAGAVDALTPGINLLQRQAIADAVVETEADAASTAADPVPPELPAPDPLAVERLRALRAGFCVSRHPLLLWPLPPRRWRTTDVSPARDGTWLELVALPVHRTATATAGADGAPQAMAFVTLEDERGSVESVWFPDAFRHHGAALDSGGPLRVAGRVEVDHGVAMLRVIRACALAGPD